MRKPYTYEELRALLPNKEEVEKLTKELEEEFPDARPLPPMTMDEAIKLFGGFMATASTRPLTDEEIFLHGQLLACLTFAAKAEALGYKGRFFVFAEDELVTILDRSKTGE